MFNNLLKKGLLIAIILLVTTVHAQKVKQPKITNKEWKKPYEPFRVVGNLYYVGTYDLSCYLITTTQGHILINTGLSSSEKTIKKNIEALGFKFSDIKILLNTQAHYDHLGAMAAIKKKTGAQFILNENDAAEAISGGQTDYALGGSTASFKPITPDKLIKNGDTISLGNMHIVMLNHPGHTKGSSSFLFTITDGQKSYKVLIANMPSIVTSKPFNGIPEYNNISADYAYTLNALKNLTFDLWLSSHASQFNLHKKHKQGDAYNPEAFRDQQGFIDELNAYKKKYEEKIKQ
jgi:metallo-beta-lactamase class B